MKFDFIVVVVYGKILFKEVLVIVFCINVYVLLLFKYRGVLFIYEMIFNDDKIYGISIMFMDVGLDSGDILESVFFLREDYLDLDVLSLKLVYMGVILFFLMFKNFYFIIRKL